MTLLSFHQAPFIDDAGALRVPSVGEPILSLIKSHTARQYLGGKKRTGLGAHPARRQIVKSARNLAKFVKAMSGVVDSL